MIDNHPYNPEMTGASKEPLTEPTREELVQAIAAEIVAMENAAAGWVRSRDHAADKARACGRRITELRQAWVELTGAV